MIEQAERQHAISACRQPGPPGSDKAAGRAPQAAHHPPESPGLMLLARWDRRLFDAGQNLPLVGPCLLVLLATLLFRLTAVDLTVSGLFHAGRVEGGFPLANHPVLLTIYYWGLVPAWLIGLGSLAVLATAALRDVSPQKRRGAAFLLALLLLGPVVLVNLVYKGHWGRPRPDQTVHFGGDQPFLHVLERGPVGDYFSFPSGHAAAGFCLIAPAFLLYRRRPRLAAWWLAFGLVFGLVVGLGRVLQGRHFLSDVFWAATIVYFTGCALDYLLLARPSPIPRHRAAPSASGRPAVPLARGSKGRRKRSSPVQPAKPRRDAA